MMHQRKGKKIIIYFFILILFGSINNIKINDFKFKKIKNIYISGLNDLENKIIMSDIKSLNLNNIFFINENEINTIMNKNTLIEKFNIFKKYPSALEIKIEKTNFLATITQNDKTFLVGSNGKLSSSNLSTTELPHIFGKPNIQEFLKFKRIIDQSNISYSQIKNLYFFQSKRWDLELENNIVIKLPKTHIKKSLEETFIFLNEDKFKNIKIVDARVKNQIIINE